MRMTGTYLPMGAPTETARATWTMLGNKVHHLIEHSAHGGDKWKTYFDGTYIPRKAAN